MTNNKSQIANNTKISNSNVLNFGIRILGLFVIWCLVLGASSEAWRINKELKEEIDIKKAAVASAQDDPHAHFDLAITYAYTNNIENGWLELKKVNDLDPTFKKKALTMYIEKVTECTADWRLRFRLAFAYYFNDKKKEAIRELDNVLKIDPYNVWAYGYIALIYGELGEIDPAMKYTRQGLKIDSNVAALHLLLSEGYYKKGDGWKGWMERLEAVRLKALGF